MDQPKASSIFQNQGGISNSRIIVKGRFLGTPPNNLEAHFTTQSHDSTTSPLHVNTYRLVHAYSLTRTHLYPSQEWWWLCDVGFTTSSSHIISHAETSCGHSAWFMNQFTSPWDLTFIVLSLGIVNSLCALVLRISFTRWKKLQSIRFSECLGVQRGVVVQTNVIALPVRFWNWRQTWEIKDVSWNCKEQRLLILKPSWRSRPRNMTRRLASFSGLWTSRIEKFEPFARKIRKFVSNGCRIRQMCNHQPLLMDPGLRKWTNNFRPT
jgi:hypothetical protein